MGKSHLDRRCPRAHGSKDAERRAEVILLSVLLPDGRRVHPIGSTTVLLSRGSSHNCISLTCKNSGTQTNLLEKLLLFDGLMLQFELTVCSVVHILLALKKSHYFLFFSSMKQHIDHIPSCLLLKYSFCKKSRSRNRALLCKTLHGLGLLLFWIGKRLSQTKAVFTLKH